MREKVCKFVFTQGTSRSTLGEGGEGGGIDGDTECEEEGREVGATRGEQVLEVEEEEGKE